MFITILNFLAIFVLTFFIGQKNSYKNFIIAISLAIFIILEILSYMYLGKKLDDEFIFFIFNIQIFHIALNTKILMVYLVVFFFLFLASILYLILKNFQIKKLKKIIITVCILILILPYGFIFKLLNVFIVDYGFDYLSSKKYTYSDIFKKVKDEEYVTNDEIKILNPGEKHKNLIMIYLESYDLSYLTNPAINKYTQDISKIAKNGEFYSNIEQLNGTMGTQAGIVSSQCGVKYLSYFIFSNPYGKINTKQKLTCFPDVLNKAGYEQIFIGGADKKLFNKGNYLLSHKYNIVEDKHSLLTKYPNFETNLNSWGISDSDIFEVAQKEYMRLSKLKKPFNITILTTATHNPNGLKDNRCKNSDENELLNAIECTNDLVKNFVDFIKKQPNYKNTIIVILPDHRQYEVNVLANKIKPDEKKLFVIILNTQKISGTKIYYTDLPQIILKRLNIKSNANFLGNQDDKISKNFIYKIH